MKYIDEFRDKDLVRNLTGRIKEFSPAGKINLMEVCGTHTMAIFRSGIKQLLPKNIDLISGPGCPVCVTSQADIDRMLFLAQTENAIITSFGDMLKVRGPKARWKKSGPQDAISGRSTARWTRWRSPRKIPKKK